MMVPAEKELRTVLAQFAEARIEHDVRPTGRTSRALEDSTYTLCVMTASRTVEEALRRADLVLEQYRTNRQGLAQEDETLAA
ncbi:DUF5133 domain-containing protein [Streptomyces beigongshangae]|uniref:DUF5133 domain-containing protein n=1 Tax=Streptomyces beigongshangae TaxID=2841597 RepID=UPI001C841C80|nr:DUF5133 domain-containing protein [Streptomyces sp. REN17]